MLKLGLPWLTKVDPTVLRWNAASASAPQPIGRKEPLVHDAESGVQWRGDTFQGKPLIKFREVKSAFAAKLNTDPRAVVFHMPEGQHINLDDTAKQLHLDEDDLIEASVHQIGGTCGPL
ncbi:hypothetical protein K437DRAFT_296435 [Tilletiaria anomala UBC 951]|uniref:Ubiquitin-like domain-containing protein n=1 Tax=Tilletiaria anomala (strain ATCC 24038 / CBS 436.72 / UBC 951) TaxID=1037660 RepID=A0A066VHI9_TILAU|nr:uncharacterized protein K437DRAFT_296435 [Tilletiaria anomala UBC 951]KDN38045.1 hypothetical protein K437DRAFT_296435 [Tilletiaria anomala UBC 951]